MYQDVPFSGGDSLPAGTLCLTYDDGPGATQGPGPGPRTLELAEYLADVGVPATFFMVGRRARLLAGVAPALARLGHLVGNHTDTHRSLLEVLETGGEAGVVQEVLRTDAALRSALDEVTYVRAPYGHWSAEVAAALNRSSGTRDGHLGPIHWDVEARDWHHWGEASSPEKCANAYLAAIEAVGRGVVLMHDCTADPTDEGVRLNALNRTFELSRLLVPELERRGYSFVRLDDVPGLAAERPGASVEVLNRP